MVNKITNSIVLLPAVVVTKSTFLPIQYRRIIINWERIREHGSMKTLQHQTYIFQKINTVFLDFLYVSKKYNSTLTMCYYCKELIHTTTSIQIPI